MSDFRLTWGDPAGPLYDQGIDRGVLYLDGTAVPWNGLVSVDEGASGLVDTEHYLDGNRLHISQETGDFEARISAFTYPDVFAEYNGYSDRDEYRRFGFSYRTQHGPNSYKIHIVYNVMVRDDSRSWDTLSADIDPSLFSWDIYASEIPIPGASPAARLMMESPRDPSVFETIEDILYGKGEVEPRLPDPAEIVELYEAATILRITYNGDGTWTATGPDEMVQPLDDGRFELNAPSAFFIDQDSFVVNSY